MIDTPKNRCGYTWPEDYEVGDSPDHQNCCFREVVDDADRCAWHVDPESSNKKNIENLKDSRVEYNKRILRSRPETDLDDDVILISHPGTFNRNLSRIKKQTYYKDTVIPCFESIDGAKLSGMNLGRISLDTVRLRDADLTDTKLTHSSIFNTDLSGANLTGIDLSFSYLIGVDLENSKMGLTDLPVEWSDIDEEPTTMIADASFLDVNFSHTTLNGTEISSSSFYNCEITDSKFNYADLSDCYISRGTIIRNSEFRYADLDSIDINSRWVRDCEFVHANLSCSNISGLHFEDSDFSHADLGGSEMRSIRISDCNLTGTNLGDADLSNSWLENIESSDTFLELSNLRDSKFEDVTLRESYFKRCNLSSARIRRSKFTNSDFERAVISDSKIEHSKFSNISFSESKITNSDWKGLALTDIRFNSVDLSGSDFRDSNFHNCILKNSDISGANFCGAKFTRPDVSGIKINKTLKLDAGTQFVGFCKSPTDLNQWDQLALGYETLRREFRQKALDDQQRKLYIFQQRARTEEKRVRKQWLGYLGSNISRFLTGYGVRVIYVAFWSILLLFIPTIVYEAVGIGDSRGGSLYYTLSTFVTSPPYPQTETTGVSHIMVQSIIYFQTFFGTVLIVLFGYVLGNRDPL